MREHKSKFITFEGIEGVGKSTNIIFAKNFLEQHGFDIILTREPGGTPVSEKIREILLNPTTEVITKETELLLMFASRKQHLETVIKPALAQGKWVLCDRYVDSSYAYQGYGREIDIDKIKFLDNWLLQKVIPDVTFIFDVPVELGLSRAKNRSQADRIEQEEIQFFQKVRDGYLDLAKQYSQRIKLIDATQSIESVQETLHENLIKIIKL